MSNYVLYHPAKNLIYSAEYIETIFGSYHPKHALYSLDPDVPVDIVKFDLDHYLELGWEIVEMSYE